MAQTIKLKRSATAGNAPSTSDLALGEVALNTNDGKLYIKTTEGSLDSIIQVGSSTDSYSKIRKSVTQSFAVKVVSKTTDHVWHGAGSSLGYHINGIEAPHLHLVPGNTYKFDQSHSSNSGHPLRFYYDAAKTTAYSAGITTSGTPGSSGAFTQIIPTDTTPVTLHYACTNHGFMGGRADFGTRNFTGFNTADLVEGTNLYHTTARSRASISVTDSGGDGSLSYNSSSGVITYTGPSASEVRAHISAGTGVAFSGGAVSIGQAVATTSNVTFNDVHADGNVQIDGNTVITGNLTVNGTQTILNTATLDVEDLNITVGKLATTSTAANGAGLTFGAWSSGTIPTFVWNHSAQTFVANYAINANTIGNATTATTLQSARNISGVAFNGSADIQLSTNGITEHSSNLYFTTARADARIAAAELSDLSNVSTTGPNNGEVLKYNGTAWAPAADNAGGGSTNGFQTISISGQSDVVADSTTDTLTLVGGTGITLTTAAGSDTVTITGTSAGANAFGNVAVSGQTTVAADSTNDTLTLVGGTNMTITTNASGDTVTFVAASGGGGAEAADAILIEHQYTATNNQTSFSGNDDNSVSLAYTANALQVFLNGVLLDNGIDYTASNGTTVVLAEGATTSDFLQIIAFKKKIGDGNVSVSAFSGNGSTVAFTLATDPGNENNTRVYIDGVYQSKANYAVSGTTLTFSTAPPNGTAIEVEMGGRVVTLDTTASIELPDNVKLKAGTGNDLEVFHDGSNSFIKDVGTGNLQLSSNNQVDIRKGTAENMATFVVDGAVTLFHDNSAKIATSATGVTVTGAVAATTFSGDLSGTINTATTAATQSASNNSTKVATTAYVDVAIAALGDSAPSTLNTLNELAAALGDDANYAATTATALGLRVVKTGANGAALLPTGTTAQRPTAAAGQLRYNSELNKFEGYSDAWGEIGGGGSSAFATDSFTANGSTTAFALTQTISSEDNLLVFIEGVFQQQDAYSIATASGTTTLTFSSAPANTHSIIIYSVAGAISGTNLTVDSMTGDASDTTLTLSFAPVNENNTQVYIDGVYQNKTTYSTSGTTLTFSEAPPTGALVECMTMNQTDINVPVDNTITTAKLVANAVTQAKIADDAVGTNQLASGLTLGGTTIATNLDISGDIDVDGTTNLDVVDIDGAVNMATTLLVAGDVSVGGTSTNPTGQNVAGAAIDATGEGNFSVNGAAALRVNRKTSNGDIVDVMVEGATIGTIGGAANDLTIFSKTSGHNGLRFHVDGILPTDNAGAIIDNDCSLGISSHRFKDLWVAGVANVQQVRLKLGSASTGGLFQEKDLIGSGSSTDTALFAESGRAIKFMVNGSATPSATIASTGAVTIPGTLHSPGHIIQTVYAQNSTTVTPSQTFDDYITIVQLNITPKFSNSKILITGIAAVNLHTGNYATIHARIYRDSTLAKQYLYWGYEGNAGTHRILNEPLHYLDSPTTTSALTYYVKITNHSGSTKSGTYNGKGNQYNASTISLQEIAQ